ncbi:MAG: class I SAM-dependent methyltransferase [Clostridia bacterium]|nr:class I SAM-dependent methyltransferase [Clostridia bacterium]
MKKVINQWNNAAKAYSESQRTAPNNLTNWQILTELVGEAKGKVVLDAGCGDGFFSNKLKKLGAKVYACDGAKAFVEMAKSEFDGIEFSVEDLTKQLSYRDNYFDIVISSLVLMDIDNIDTFFGEANRILKMNGKLIFSIMHPCFFLPDWVKDQNGKKLYKKVETYLQEKTELLHFWGETTHYHRTLSDYSKRLKKAGFAISEIRESPEDKQFFKNLPEQQQRVPLFVAIECIKCR